MSTQVQVNEALANALDNGFDFTNTDPLEVAEDLGRFNADFESVEPEELVPYIIEWQSDRNRK